MNISPNSVLSRETIVTLGSKLAPSAAILGRLRLLGLRRADCCDARGRLPEERFEFPIRALDISGVRPNFCAVRFCGLVAQLDRALGFESGVAELICNDLPPPPISIFALMRVAGTERSRQFLAYAF